MKIKTIVNRLVVFMVTLLQLFMLSLLISPIPFTLAVLVAYVFGFVKSIMNLWLLILGMATAILVCIIIYYAVAEMATAILVCIIIYYAVAEVIEKKQQKKESEYFKSLNNNKVSTGTGKEVDNGTC